MSSQRNGASGGVVVKGRVIMERSISFHGRSAAVEKLRRPRTVPDLMASARNGGGAHSAAGMTADLSPKLTKVLLNVTIQGSVGAVQVLMSPDLTVKDLISTAVKQHVKEGRRPLLSNSAHGEFDLHYSQFSLESLDREEKLVALGSRNFFMCRRKVVADGSDGSLTTTSCSNQAEKATKLNFSFPWLKFMSFLL